VKANFGQGGKYDPGAKLIRLLELLKKVTKRSSQNFLGQILKTKILQKLR
jgi:hypothetical protein